MIYFCGSTMSSLMNGIVKHESQEIIKQLDIQDTTVKNFYKNYLQYLNLNQKIKKSKFMRN